MEGSSAFLLLNKHYQYAIIEPETLTSAAAVNQLQQYSKK